MTFLFFSKRAQSWIFEYIVSFLIFLGLLFIAINVLSSTSSKSYFEDVARDADHISSLFLSEGMPDNWSNSSVLSVGLMSDGRVDLNKMGEYDLLTYNNVKSLLGVSSEFLFYFENSSGMMLVDGLCYRGFVEGCGDFKSFITYNDLATSRRIVVLDSSIVELVVVVFR
ncbi:MAG: hypothetical protein ACLFN8_01395 [Candidatus Woesearchaeota archaeon]